MCHEIRRDECQEGLEKTETSLGGEKAFIELFKSFESLHFSFKNQFTN